MSPCIANETWQRDCDIIVAGLLEDLPPFSNPSTYVADFIQRIEEE